MQGRDFEREPQCSANEERPGLTVAREQTGAGDGRKRDCAEQLGKVGKSVTVIGIGPGPVEDVLAVGMRLGVEGHGTDERCALPQCQIARRPTRALAGTPRLMQRMQKFVTQERMSPRERIPCSRLNGAERIDNPDRRRVFLQSTRSEVVPTVADYRID